MASSKKSKAKKPAAKKPAAKKATAVGKKPSGKKKVAGEPVNLPEPVARKLLQLLSTDDGFRRRFTKNPHAGLLEAAGIDPRCAGCATPTKLASKKAIAAAHDELLEMLTCHNTYNPVQLSV